MARTRATHGTVEAASRIVELLLGPPLSSRDERRERLGKPSALAVLSSDALSSVAYATEEMVRVLLPVAGIVALSHAMPISCVILALLFTLTDLGLQRFQADWARLQEELRPESVDSNTRRP